LKISKKTELLAKKEWNMANLSLASRTKFITEIIFGTKISLAAS